MAFFRDLSPFRYSTEPQLQSTLNVGWLAPFRYRSRGRTPVEFRRKLFELCARPQVRHRGYHRCVLGVCAAMPRRYPTTACLNGRRESLGSGIVILRGAHDSYAAPNLVYHYVTRHGYRPPEGFIAAVLAWEG